MSTSASQPGSIINPADYPELEEVQDITIPEDKKKETHPFILRAVELGLDRKLRRYEDCRRFSRYHACENGHMHCEQSSRCGLRCLCKNCAELLAMAQLHKFEPLERFMPERFTYTEIVTSTPASHESLVIAEHLALKVLDGLPGKKALKVSVSRERTPEVRIIYGGIVHATADPLTTILQAKFPAAKIITTVHYRNNFYASFKKLVADVPFTAGDPYRADLELMFNHIRQIHVSGFSRTELSVCTSKSKHTNNSDETAEVTVEKSGEPCAECGQQHEITRRKCKTCGLPMDHVSHWFLTYQFPQGKDPTKLKWKDGWRPKAT